MASSTDGGSLQKAYILLVEPPTGDGIPDLRAVTSGTQLKRIDFMFNPSSYTVTKTASWNPGDATAAKGVPLATFGGTQAATMDLDILIDHSEKATPEVAEMVDKMLTAVVPTADSLRRKEPQPPWAVFGWGSRIPMVGFISTVTATYTLFRPDGVPVRARCKVTMNELPTDPMPMQNPTSGSDRVVRQHVVVAGDSLPSIAQQAYGEPGRWRDIAEVNRIDDPMQLVEGHRLLVPDPGDLEEGRVG